MQRWSLADIYIYIYIMCSFRLQNVSLSQYQQKLILAFIKAGFDAQLLYLPALVLAKWK